jgi:hypothetical protein
VAPAVGVLLSGKERERQTMACQTALRHAMPESLFVAAGDLVYAGSTPWSDSARSGHLLRPNCIHLAFISMSLGLDSAA